MEGAGAPSAPSAPLAQAQPPQAAPPLAAPANQASRGMVDQAKENLPGLQSPQCNIPVCQRLYRSFHAFDCTYQPSRGGPGEPAAANLQFVSATFFSLTAVARCHAYAPV
jgi:hypothetical protein